MTASGPCKLNVTCQQLQWCARASCFHYLCQPVFEHATRWHVCMVHSAGRQCANHTHHTTRNISLHTHTMPHTHDQKKACRHLCCDEDSTVGTIATPNNAPNNAQRLATPMPHKDTQDTLQKHWRPICSVLWPEIAWCLPTPPASMDLPLTSASASGCQP